MFMNSFSLRLLFREIRVLFAHTGAAQAQPIGALGIHVESDSVSWPTYAPLSGQEGLAGFLPAHLQFVYPGRKIHTRKCFVLLIK